MFFLIACFSHLAREVNVIRSFFGTFYEIRETFWYTKYILKVTART